jgi:hypothetical protein
LTAGLILACESDERASAIVRGRTSSQTEERQKKGGNQEEKRRTSFNNFSTLPFVKLLTPILFTFPLSTSSSIALQVGNTSFVKFQSTMGFPSGEVPEKATGQLRV